MALLMICAAHAAFLACLCCGLGVLFQHPASKQVLLLTGFQYSPASRCLRKTVIDFIGNFRNAYKIVEYQSLHPFEESDLIPDFKHARNRKEVLNLPLNCEVHFDEKVVKVFADQALDPRHATRHNIGKILMYAYDKLRHNLGRKPSKRDVDQYSMLDSSLYALVFGSWAAFEKLVDGEE